MNDESVQKEVSELITSSANSLERLATGEGFPPYAITLEEDGPGAILGTPPGAPPEEAVPALTQALKQAADAGTLKGFAIVFDATMTNADTGESQDAVRILIEHRAGVAEGFAIPYKLEGSEKRYGEPCRAPSRPVVFGADSPESGREQAEEFIRRIPDMARAHVEKVRSTSGVELQLDDACFARTDEVIQEGWGGKAPGNLELVVITFGSFIGEAIRTLHGGEWAFDEQNSVVYLRDVGSKGVSVFPFDKLRKRFVNGEDDSIAEYYRELATRLN